MRKVLHKVKSQWVVLGVLGAMAVSLGTADVRQAAASEIEGANVSETLAARELGTADITLAASEKAAHLGMDNAVSTGTTDGTATVFVHWNEDGTITVTVKDLNGSVLYSDLLVDSAGENSIQVLTANQDYYTIAIAVETAATEEMATETLEQVTPGIQAAADLTEENAFAKIVATTDVAYPAVIARATDAINTAPWGVQGYQTLASSADYVGKTVDVTKEQVTDYGVTWAQISLDGEVLGWIAKEALTAQTYAAIVSETVVDYPATINRATDAINKAPWGTKGFQTITTSATYAGKTVDVTKEQTTDYGVTWAQISLNGEVLGWIAKDALKVQTYAAVVSETAADYPATISRDSDAINTAPWGVKGYQTLSSSAAYVGKTVEVTKEQVTDYGVTWAQISLNGEVLGWIAKDALKVQTYAQITKETEVDYSATIRRDSDAINTAPWGVKGYQTLSSSAAYVGKTVEVTEEQVTDYGVTWAQISLNGEVLGWIAKDALKVQTYAQITKETAVNYDAIVHRDSDAINTAPWGVKGYRTLSSSAAYVGETVEVIKEQLTDYGVTWAQVSLDGEVLGWIAKDALKVQTYAQITKETAVNYDAIVNRDSDAINTAPWGVKGYQTLSSSAAYVGKTVEVIKEQLTDYGVTWAQISLDGEVLGWIAKDALKVQTYAQIVSESEVAYPALISRGTDAINTAPWGTKGYQTNASSADYLGQTVEVTKEQTTDYGVTWSLVSLNGKKLGWIAKDALTVLERTLETVVAKENTVAHQTFTEEDNSIPTGERVVVQAGADGYDTVTYDVTYVNGIETGRVELSRTTTAPVNEIIKVGTQVTEVKSETTTENEVAFTTVEEEDNTIPTGERAVAQTGAKGYDTVIFDVTYVNGIETNRVETSRTTTALVTEIVKVGTQVTEIKSETTTENEIAFTTVEAEDNTIPTGERVVVKTGAKGYDTVMFDVTYVNGVETGRVEISRVTTAPVSEIVKVGTQVTEIKSETTIENEVDFTTVEEEDNTIPTGERAVAQTGAKGYDTVMFDVTYVNGVETGRVEISRVTTAPVSEIVKVGTQVTEVKSETTTENEIAFTTVEEEDNTIPTGERVVVQAGADGYETVTYDVTYVNGIETNRVETSRATTAPVAEVIKVGTQVTEFKTETATENEVVFSTVEEEDNTIPTGERILVQTGADGYDTVTYDVTYVNGIETNRIEVSRTTTAPVAEIVKVGTQVTEVKTETATENEVGFTTVEEEDNTIPIGERILVQTGANGYDTVTCDVTYVNGIETNRIEVSRKTTAAVNEIIKIGTKISVEDIVVTSADEYSIILNGSTLQMAASISPDDATIPEVTWSVEAGTGTATIDSTGFLTATSAGTVTVVATANDGSGVSGTKVIEIATPVEITGYNGSDLDVVIPEVIEFGNYGDFSVGGIYESGKKGIVTSIGSEVFSNKQLVSVVIPDSVTSIGSHAFFNNQLTNVVIPKMVKSLGDYAFAGNQLTSIVIPEFVKSISGGLFYGNQLTSVEIPDGVTSIGFNAFYNNQLISVTIPESVTSIGSEAFRFNQLFSVAIPNRVTSIGNYAFSNNLLTGVVIPDSVTFIGTEAFRENQLTSVEIPAGMTSIGSWVFSDNLLVSVEIPDSVINIGWYAFENNQLTSVEIPDSVTSIGMGAFNNNLLSSIEIPESVTSIGSEAFRSNLLADVVIPFSVKSIGAEAFSYNQLTSVVISDGVTSVGSYSFSNNQLTSLVIPTSVTAIGSYAFQNNRLTDIVLPEGIKVVGTGALSQNQLTSITIGTGVQIGDNLLGMDNNFRNAYTIGGAGTYQITQNGEWIKISKVMETVIENIVVYETVMQEDGGLAAGQTEVLQTGVDGYDTVTYEVTYENGTETGRIETSRITTAPLAEVISVGTKDSVADVTPPVIDTGSLNISQSTATAGETVVVSVNVTDDKEVGNVEIAYELTDGSYVHLPMQRNAESGLFEAVLVIGENSRLGLWSVAYLSAYDSSGNYSLGSGYLGNGSFTVTGTEGADVTPPVIDTGSLNISQPTATAGETVVVAVNVTDDKEVGNVEIAYQLSDGNIVLLPMQFNAATGLYEAAIAIDGDARLGEWTVAFLSAYDGSGNYSLGSGYLGNGSFTVTGTEDADVTPPVIDTGSLNVSQPTATAGETVVVSVNVTDDKEVGNVEIAYQLSDGNIVLLPMQFNAATGLYEAAIAIDGDARLGEWTIAFLRAYDGSGNYSLGSGYLGNASFTIF